MSYKHIEICDGLDLNQLTQTSGTEDWREREREREREADPGTRLMPEGDSGISLKRQWKHR